MTVDTAYTTSTMSTARSDVFSLPPKYEAEGVFISSDSLQDLAHVVWIPWGNAEVHVQSIEGEPHVFCMGPSERDGSNSGQMKCQEIQKIQDTFNVTFQFHLSAEGKPTLPKGVEKGAVGIPPTATAFQFIYPVVNRIIDNTTHKIASSSVMSQVLSAINCLQNQALKDFLQIGGFYYHAGEWTSPDSRGMRTRGIAGWRALSPDAKTETQLCFGQATLLTGDMVDELRVFSRQKEYPALCGITVGPFYNHSITHFKWLPPGDATINKMQNFVNDKCFGHHGAFMYYDSVNPEKSCMAPIISKKESNKMLRNYFYLKIKNPRIDQYQQIYLVDDHCTVCMDELPAIKTDPCHHVAMCGDCANDPRMDDKCPICKAPIEKKEELSELLPVKSFNCFPSEISFYLHREAINHNIFWIKKLISTGAFVSPKFSIPESFRKQLCLGSDFHEMAFLYPVFAKGLDLLVKWNLFVEIQAEKDSPDSHEGLKNIGAFVFYDKNGKLLKIYSMADNSEEGKTVSIIFQKEVTSKEHSDAINQEIEISRDTEKFFHNVCRISHGPFLEYAKYFAFIDGKFVYKPYLDVSATLTALQQED